jgi:hypothetical protein
MTEDITEHGAMPNPDDSSFTAAKRNWKAVLDAAKATGDGGEIYVPEGTYYFARDSRSSFFEFGGQEPAGVSITGDGPERSALGVSRHTDASSHPIQTGFYYDDGADHGTVTISDIRLDGNYENLPDLRGAGGGARCMNVAGSGDLHLSNAHIRGWYQEAILGRDVLRTVDRCTFEDNAIADHNYSDGGHVGHHITTHASEGNPLTVTNSHFIDCSGSAIDVRFNTGEIRMQDCHVTGTGANLCKLSASSRFDVRRVYHRANTASLESKIDEKPGENFYGRCFINRLSDRTGVAPTVYLEDVETRDHMGYAIQAAAGQLELQGDNFAIHNATFELADEVFRDRDGAHFSDVTLDRVSVHDSEQALFGTENSDGTIKTLARSGNGGLGDTGAITIEADEQGADPLTPDVPAASDVGINSESDDSGEDTPSTSEPPLFDHWTPQWSSTTSDWSVDTGSELTGKSALAFENTDGNRTRYAISADDVGRPEDVEVLDKFRVPSFATDAEYGFHARVYLRASTANGIPNGYWIEVEDREDAFRLSKYTDGNVTTIARFGTPQENKYFWRRFRVEGAELKAKVWPAGTDEPTEWDVIETDSDHADGWVGLGSFDPQRVETDVFSAATGGATAQSLASETKDTIPSVSWVTPIEGEPTSGEVTVQIAASDEEDAADELTVQHRVDDANWTEATYNADTGHHEGTWDTTGVDDGDYRLEARVTDSGGNDVTASITVTVDNETASNPPKIEAVDVSRTDIDGWSRFDVDWTVTDADADLDMVVTTLHSQGTVVAADSTRVSGDWDSYTHRLRDRGEVDELRITVNDVENQVDSLSETL